MRRKRVAKPERIDHPHVMAQSEKLRDEDAADVSRSTCNENHSTLPYVYLHRSPTLEMRPGTAQAGI